MKRKKAAQKKKPILYRVRIILIPLLILFGLSIYIIPQTWDSNSFCANSISCIKDLSGAKERSTEGEFMGNKVSVPQAVFADNPYQYQAVLGESASNKKIYVDLTNQKLYAYESDNLVHSFLVSTGKWGKTPTGTFKIWVKLRSTRMSGGSKVLGTYYNLPNVPHTMYFSNDEIPKSRGFGLHGAYWHNNFGHPMSHGCVNIGLENAEKLYNWAHPVSTGNTTYANEENPGTEVVIYGVAPNE